MTQHDGDNTGCDTGLGAGEICVHKLTVPGVSKFVLGLVSTLLLVSVFKLVSVFVDKS